MAALHFLSSTIFSCVVFMFIHSFKTSLSLFFLLLKLVLCSPPKNINEILYTHT